MIQLLLLLLPLLSLEADPLPHPQTFRHTDPLTGTQVECERCPPGSYLKERCSTVRRSECSPCPRGTFTEVWNHIRYCLPCSGCYHNQEVQVPCNATNDCQCRCRDGSFYQENTDSCRAHRSCEAGEGVAKAGTPDEDTQCEVCPDGTFSNMASALLNCSRHQNCSAADLQLLLRGATWHDSICTSCQQITDGALYLREILPSFFAHQKMSARRLQRIVQHLPSDGGRRPHSGTGDLHARIREWSGGASGEQVLKLPSILNKFGQYAAEERLQHKLDRIQQNLRTVCGIGNHLDE